ncbi:MAG TPA: RNA 2',3'-cyclic phosphodiesterase [Methylotenera sp.]|nr:RNA 2',3'-cyclic phosphodiesterase [Methylotenera sp.]
MNATKDSGVARVFFALWPEILVRQALHTLATKYQSQCEARVMAADSLHMTLLFLGEVKRTRLLQLMQTADKVSVPPFGFVLERLSFWQHNRIAYATTVVEAPTLHQLAAALQQEVLAAGFLFESDVESHEFTPHVTLLRNVRHVLEPQPITPITWRVDSFVLVESVTTDQGVRYHVLQKWRLPPFDQTSSVEPPVKQT